MIVQHLVQPENCFECSLDMVEVFGRTKLHKKGSRNIFSFYLRKLSRFCVST